MIITYPDDIKFTLYLQNKPEENFLDDTRGRYFRIYYRIRNSVLDYSDYLFQYIEKILKQV